MAYLNNRVFFRRPDTERLARQGFAIVDMHFHSKYSDSLTRINDIIKKAKNMKIGVAVTDHNEIRGCIDAAKSNSSVMIIPSMEVTSFEGPHLLTYFYTLSELAEFYNKYVKNSKFKDPYSLTKLKVADVINAADGYNCLISAAHPYGYFSIGLLKAMNRKIIGRETINGIGALEAISGEMSRKINLKAVKSASFLEKAITAGSDGHSLFQLGRCISYSEAQSVEEFLDAVKKHKNFVVGKETNIFSKIIPLTKSFTKHMRYVRPLFTAKYLANRDKRIIKKSQRRMTKQARRFR